jgi:class 3 adenylate cyclase/predicted ATPase
VSDPTANPLIDQLRSTIAALQSQRAILGSAVVDMAVAPLQAQLQALLNPDTQPAALQATRPAPPAPASTQSPSPSPSSAPTAPTPPVEHPAAGEQLLRQVTILFLDVVGSTPLSQRLDPEQIHAVMDGALQRCTAVVQQHGGRVLQYAGDNLLAVFGAPVPPATVREDDTERAVRCGLALLAQGRQLGADVQRQHGHTGFDVRVGLHTGPVLLGGGVDAEGTIRGMAVNVAARMEQTAPPGALRISHDTYRHVRGVFDVQPQPPMAIKGLDEPMLTYLVDRAKKRAFRTTTRGIEGIETRMVGRDTELATLQRAFIKLHHHPELSVQLVVGEGGVGKSRLMYEFSNWAEARPERFFIFQGRANPQTQSQPFGLLRDVLAWRLQIADTDSEAVARHKIEAGITPLFTADEGPAGAQAQAHLLGHLIGLDFSTSPHVQGILDDPRQIRARGFHAGVQAFRRFSTSAGLPIVLLLDDLQWADDGSLDFLAHMARSNADVPTLVLASTRATLFERAGGPVQAFTSLAGLQLLRLQALPRAACLELAAELFKRLPHVPEALSALVIDRAEGNPFYMEELVQMLVDQGALQTSGNTWQLDASKLMAAKVPPTLTGILQARLDGLPAPERLALQQASVIGLVFWQQALQALDAAAPAALPALAKRSLVAGRVETSVEGALEFEFKHQILHEVTYDTLLKRVKRDLHAAAGHWLANLTGLRAKGMLGAAAEHFAKAGDAERAAQLFTRAAEAARERFAHEATLAYVEKALALMPDNGQAADPVGAEAQQQALQQRWRLLDLRERTLDLHGRRPEQQADLASMQVLADTLGDNHRRADLCTRRSLLAGRLGDYPAQQAAAQQAMTWAASVGDTKLRLNAQRLLADALARMGDVSGASQLAESGLQEARADGLLGLESRFLNALSVVAGQRQDLVALLQTCEQATRLRSELGDRRNEAIGLSTLGGGWMELGAFEQARADLDRCLKLHRTVGDRALEPIALANLSQLALWQLQPELALRHAQVALATAVDVQAKDLQTFALWCLGNAELALNRLDDAQATFGRAMALVAGSASAYRHDVQAGLARVALARLDSAAALEQALPLLQHVDANTGPGKQGDAPLVDTARGWGGTLGARLIQMTLVRCLQATGHPRAQAVLQDAQCRSAKPRSGYHRPGIAHELSHARA